MFEECSVRPVAEAKASATVPPSARFQALVDAVEGLRGLDPAASEPLQALADLRALLLADTALRGLRLQRLADAHARRLHALDDAPTAGAWLGRQDVETDRGDLALARRLGRWPAVEAALLAQQVSTRTAARLARALDGLAPHLDRPDGLVDGLPGEDVVRQVVVEGVLGLAMPTRGGLPDDDPALRALVEELRAIADRPVGQAARLEAALLVLAEQVPPAHLDGALEQLVCAVLPWQLQDRSDRGHERRGLRLVRSHDGTGWSVQRGDLDEATGELLMAVLVAARAVDPDNPVDTSAARQADDDSPLGLPLGPGPRSRDQRDHDALRLALRLVLDSGALGTRGKQAPHLSVVVGLAALHGAPGALPARSTTTGAPLAIGTVRSWLPDSRLTRFVLGLGHRVVESSHTERTLKAHERRLLELEWGGRCAGAACLSPPGTPLVPHHGEAWHRGGTTSLSDSFPFCPCCHAHVHRGGRLRLRDGRVVTEDGVEDPPDQGAA